MNCIIFNEQNFKAIFPRAPQAVVQSFLDYQDKMAELGINHTRQRLNFFFANIEHECGGFGLKGLAENINYTHSRAAEIFGHRIGRTAQEVVARFGTEQGRWQRAMIDVVYGNRMGNGPPETHDGSKFIGRGGPQITGKDGYREIDKRIGTNSVSRPEVLAGHAIQAAICCAFADWKKLNTYADRGDFKGYVRAWNGGSNGMADRLHHLAGNDPIIERLKTVAVVKPTTKAMPGQPPTAEPPKAVLDEATKKERATRNAGAGGAVIGGSQETATQTGTVAQENAPLPAWATYGLILGGLSLALLGIYLVARMKLIVKSNWS